jgi:hypothetical protein
MSELIYHFTSSWHLPKILRTGAILPTAYDRLGDDLVWGTCMPEGDDTAKVFHYLDRFEAGKIKLVRFSFPKQLFISWPDFKEGGTNNRHLALGHHFDEYEEATLEGCYESDPDTSWFLHLGKLPIRHAVAIDQRTFKGRWRPVPIPPRPPNIWQQLRDQSHPASEL